MPRPKKLFFHDSIHFVTLSVEEDFMFPPNPLINELIRKCLAQAQELHPIKVSALVVESTHIHMLVQVICPTDAADFFERFKTESAHAVNRLLGRKKRTVWCAGYDSPLIDDVDTIVDKIAYIYENPSKDALVESVDQYPGLCTWREFKRLTPRTRTTHKYETRYIARDKFTPLPEGPLKEKDYERMRRKLIHKREKNYFEVDFTSWMKRFGITDPHEQHEVNQEIIAKVREREAEHQKERESEKRSVIGRKRLVETEIGAAYRPNRNGRRMLVHALDKKFRKKQILWIRKLIAAGREVYERWKLGDLSIPYPMGLFPPHGLRLVEPIRW